MKWKWKENLESFAKLARHATVDGEVEGIGQTDEEVDEDDQRVDGVVVERGQLETVVDDVEDGDGGQRDLDQEEDGHDDDEHERGAVRIAQFAALALLLVLFEELVALELGLAQCGEQQDVEHYQREAR